VHLDALDVSDDRAIGEDQALGDLPVRHALTRFLTEPAGHGRIQNTRATFTVNPPYGAHC
jgi:hypothetical protein